VTGEQLANLREVVSIDADKMSGAPCFKGTRVPVSLLLNNLKAGYTIDQFLDSCPSVSRQQVERFLDLAQESLLECVSS
jgi:uncharacterized protein (DUF433 family)